MDYKHNQKAFRERNMKEWKSILETIFGGSIPEHYEWTLLHEISKTIDKLGGKNLNHMLYPDGGGLDILGCEISTNYRNLLEINVGGIPSICKPDKLVFDSISNDPEWSYFRLELQEMESSNVYEDSSREEKIWEELYEIAPNEFEAYSEYPSYEGSRHITRVLKGTLLIIPKSCFYNSIPSTYDGRHSRCTHVMFREYMKNLKNSESYQNFLFDFDNL